MKWSSGDEAVSRLKKVSSKLKFHPRQYGLINSSVGDYNSAVPLSVLHFIWWVPDTCQHYIISNVLCEAESVWKQDSPAGRSLLLLAELTKSCRCKHKPLTWADGDETLLHSLWRSIFTKTSAYHLRQRRRRVYVSVLLDLLASFCRNEALRDEIDGCWRRRSALVSSGPLRQSGDQTEKCKKCTLSFCYNLKTFFTFTLKSVIFSCQFSWGQNEIP